MNSRFHPLMVLALGIVCFGSGIVLRLHSAEFAASTVKAGPNKLLEGVLDPSSYSEAMSISQPGNATSEIAVVLLWTGGALVVTSALTQRFIPDPRSRHPAPAEPGSRTANHRFLGNLR